MICPAECQKAVVADTGRCLLTSDGECMHTKNDRLERQNLRLEWYHKEYRKFPGIAGMNRALRDLIESMLQYHEGDIEFCENVRKDLEAADAQD